MLKKWSDYLLLGGAALLLSACQEPLEPPRAADPWVAVARGRVDVDAQARKLAVSQDGVVARVLVREGQRVQPGELVLEQDAGPEREQWRLDEKLAAEQALAVRSAEQQLASAVRETRRLQPLAADDSVARRELDQARDAELEAQTGLERERAALDSARQRVALSREAWQRYSVRTPVGGVVERVLLQGGEYAEAGRLALRLIPDGARIVRAELDEAYIGRVRAGLKVTLLAEGGQGTPVAGHVLRLGQEVATASPSDEPGARQDARVVECVIAVDGKLPWLLGQRVVVRFAGS